MSFPSSRLPSFLSPAPQLNESGPSIGPAVRASFKGQRGEADVLFFPPAWSKTDPVLSADVASTTMPWRKSTPAVVLPTIRPTKTAGAGQNSAVPRSTAIRSIYLFIPG